MDEMTNNDNKRNEIPEIYKIFKEIHLKAIPVLKDLSHNSIEIDYREWVDDKNKIDFNKINQKFEDEKYSSMTDAIKDIRLVFLNCYTFYGIKSDFTKQSLQLEDLFEEKINCLDENIKPLADIQLTFNLLNIEKKPNFKFRYPKDCYDSMLLRSVAHCRPERLKEYHKILSTTLTNDDDNNHTLEELISWENEIYFNKNYQYISSMWELPEIGNFIAIIFKAFDIDVINQGEIERMFLMPKESTTMSKIMTVLLMPIKRTKDIEQIIPYSVWSKKLCKKVSDWYKVYHIQNRNKVKVMNSLGIHPDFWVVVGDKNPLVKHDYCELSYFIKVWLIKGLCDHITNKYKIINDIMTNCNERQCTIWKNDMETEEYFFFDSMPDLRIYYYNIAYDEPSLEFLETEYINNEVAMNEVLSVIGVSSVFHSNSRVKPNQKHFKLIADSVQGLRSYLEELDTEDTSVPENLISALENFIIKIEPEECNLIILNNNSKIKLFKDWKSYQERIDKDILLLRGMKELKSISQGLCQEIILEKRKRKAVVQQGFDNEIKFDSDEYFTETDDEDFTDSEDEWGAMNQPKSKTKQLIQTHSKLVELEKRLKEEGKIPIQCKKSTLECDTNNKLPASENKNDLNYDKQKEKVKDMHKTNTYINGCSEKLICSTINDSGIIETIRINESNDDTQKENKVNNTHRTNSFVNGSSSKKLVCSKIITSDSIKIEAVSDGEKIIPMSEMGKNENSCKKQKNDFINKQPDVKKMKLNILKDVDIVTIDDDKLDDCTIIGDDNSSEEIINNINEQHNHCTKNHLTKLNLKNNAEIISIEDNDNDNDEIVISDDDDVQIVSITPRTPNTSVIPRTPKTPVTPRNQNTSITLTPRVQNVPVKISRSYSLNNNFNKSLSSTSGNKRMVITNFTKKQVVSTSIPKLSPDISIMPANVHLPKGIEVTMIKKPQATIPSHFNSIKRSTSKSNDLQSNNPSVVNVKCKIMSEPNSKGEVTFYVSLPNGKKHIVSDELMNQYLKEHNNRLPDYWLVPLPIEVAKQYGFY